MDKEKLIKLAEDLYQSAFDANAYYAKKLIIPEGGKHQIVHLLVRLMTVQN